MNFNLKVIRGDITRLKVEAIVNAANQSLLGGGGVDGAIHRAAGPELLAECRTLGGCPTGEARITRGYCLPAKYVIHTVGPVWRDGKHQEPDLLQNCYRNSLKLALDHQIKSIAFPNISTGIYGFPKNIAAKIALETTRKFLRAYEPELEVIFCCFDEENHRLYREQIHPATP